MLRSSCIGLWLACAIACETAPSASAPQAGTGVSGATASGGTTAIVPTGGVSAGTGGMLAGAGGSAGSAGMSALDASIADASTTLDASTPDANAPDAEIPRDPNLPTGVDALFPARNADSACVDAPLRITLSAPPTLGDTGAVEIFDAASSSTPVATFDMGDAATSDTIDGDTYAMPRRAYVDGNTASFYFHSGTLDRGHSYFVHVSDGALAREDGTPLVIDDATTWAFTTAATAPVLGTTLHVGGDDGDYCTLQAALDAIPAGNTPARTLQIAAGHYHEIIHFEAKHNLTLRGADRKATVISGVNNEQLNGGTAKRALVGIDDVHDLTIENLTIENLTPQGGSQAEALRVQRCDKCRVLGADIVSLQDTLLWSGRVYAHDCFIAGNVDFIWGTGVAYFDACEIKTLGRKGYTVQARNAAGAYGYVFSGCKLTSDPGITGHFLGRVDVSVYPASHVTYVDCEMGPHIDPAGWMITGFGTASLRFWEYGSVDPSGTAIDMRDRLSAATAITSAQADTMRDPSVVLGGWDPR